MVVLRSTDSDFHSEFEPFRRAFLDILNSAYSRSERFYGDDYQLRRLREGQCAVYIASVSTAVVGVAYIKSNLRRGATAVFPPTYRRLGIAEELVKASFHEFPEQYSLVSASLHPMLRLLQKVGFKKAASKQEVRTVVRDERAFALLSDFRVLGDHVLFNRHSASRATDRTDLTLLHTFHHAPSSGL